MTAANWLAAQYDGRTLRVWPMRGAEVVDVARVIDVGAADFVQALPNLPDLPVLMADFSGTLPGANPQSVPASATLKLTQTDAGARKLWLAHGMTQATPRARLHGQVAIAAGVLAADPGFDGVICVVGHQSQWIRVSAQEVCHFQGYLTGEIFDWIAENMSESSTEAFLPALDDALSRPHRAYGALHSHRGAKGSDAVRLAGLLIGCELADAKAYWLGETVAVAGTGPLSELLVVALQHQGVQVSRPDHDAALLAGLHQAWTTLPNRS